jgi:molecular chaperone GrpE
MIMTEEKDNRVPQSSNQDGAGASQPVGASQPADDEIIEGEIIEESNVADEASVADTSGGIPTESVPLNEYNALAEELQQQQVKAKDYFEGWQRERADFANYKRRIDRDQQLISANMKGDIMKRYLPVLDDLERALKARPTEDATATWAEGIELIYRKLQNILEAEGLQRIPAEKQQFNPTFHEAITHEDNPDHESGQVIEVVQQGYTLGDRVLRPALVRVAR